MAQRLQAKARTEYSGTVRDIKTGQLSILTKDGKAISCKIQDEGDRGITIGGRPTRFPASIEVTGALPMKLVEKGMVVEFTGRANAKGKYDGVISEVKLLSDPTIELSASFAKVPEKGEFADIDIVGSVLSFSRNKMQLRVPKSAWSKSQRILFEVSEDCQLKIFDNNLKQVKPGDTVKSATVIEFTNGENVIEKLKIELSPDREEMEASFEDKLEQKFSTLSDEPTDPRQFTLPRGNFILYTDLSERESNILMAKLETMHGLIANYFGKRPRIPIECYVISDMKKWRAHDLDPNGVRKILEPAGITLSRRLPGGREAKSVVYSCDKHGVCQHEAVHAFCAQAFGSTGPVWYSEGMAEIGQYWKPGELAVDIDPYVISYLTSAKPKKMLDIVAADQITGDSWQAYAWRWALCHLLANNPNYSRRFKALGLNMMAGGKETFETAFGSVAPNISFEYDQFVKNFGNGYRVDLCAWDWSVKPRTISGTKRVTGKFKATNGWQPTKLSTIKDASYDYQCEGEWKTASVGEGLSADGDGAGNGKLMGIILHDFKVEGPFDLGAKGSFVAPAAGQLYVRCRDNWTELADNEGEIKLTVKKTPAK